MPKAAKYPTPEAEYVQSPLRPSTRDLAVKWGISYNTLQRWCAKGKWVKTRREFHGDLMAKAGKQALKLGEQAFADDLRQEEQDLKDVRSLILNRLRPIDLEQAPNLPSVIRDALAVLHPTSFATLVTALVAVDKQLCLRRGIHGSEPDVPLTIRIVPPNGTGPDAD